VHGARQLRHAITGDALLLAKRAAGTLGGTALIALLTIASGKEWLMIAAQGRARRLKGFEDRRFDPFCGACIECRTADSVAQYQRVDPKRREETGMRPLLVTAVAVVAVLAVPGTALTAFPGDNGRIAFDSDRDGGDVDVWTINPDGSDPLNLTADSPAADFSPAWSADGERIAFVRDPGTPEPPAEAEIWVMRADGSGQKQLTDNDVDDFDPAWSPNGRRIVFARDPDGSGPIDSELWIMRADGSRERQLTNNEVDDFEPAWSPNGRRIAFDRDTDPNPAPEAADFDIFDIRPRGGGERQLTDAAGFDGGPNYSPDGKKIAFDSERDGDPDVWVMRRDGTHPKQLTGEDPAEEAVDILSAYSPDGKFIAFSTNRDSTPEAENFEVYVMRADGSDATNRTNNPAFDFNPDWQPLKHHHDDDEGGHDD
jgi:Tol biopolymer transport system component